MTGFLDSGLIESGAGYQIQRSLRTRASASANLSRTFGSPTDGKKWTISRWIKRGSMGSSQTLMAGGSSSNDFSYLGFLSGDTFTVQQFDASVQTLSWTSNAVFRDPSAWYHVVVQYDSTQATGANRLSVWVNNVLQSGTYAAGPIAQNTLSRINTATTHYLNRYFSAANYFDGYLSEVNFVDGQALTPSSFGQTDPTTGQWTAKKYTGTYGTNGFYLDFKDNSSTTNLCLDRSGNGNNWTPNNISLTAGATYDSMTDVPLAYGTTDRGNYCVLNPLDYSSGTLSNANTQWAAGTGVGNGCFGSQVFDIADTANKYYWEMTITSGDGVFGIVPLTTAPASTARPGSYSYYTAGNKYSGTSGSAYGSSFTVGDIIGVAVGDGGITFYKNNVSQGVAFTGLSGSFKPAIWEVVGTFQVNFGQRPFQYTPPTGFKALHTGNLLGTTVVTSGTFTGNAAADGPFIWCNGTPETLTINGNAVTWGTHADKLANGFKLRTSSASYNSSGSNTWTATYLSPSSKSAFKYQNAKGNP